MGNEFSEKKGPAAGASAPASAPILGGGGGVESPSGERGWAQPSLRGMAGGPPGGRGFGAQNLGG